MSGPAAHGEGAPARLRPALPASARRSPRAGRRALVVAAFAVAAVLPLLLAEGSPTLDNMVLTATYVTMALGLNVVVGFAGLLDLGYVAFFAIGAHVTASFASAFWAGAAGGRRRPAPLGRPGGRGPGLP